MASITHDMKLNPESVLAWAAAVVGIVGVASALTPELANRSEFVQGILPGGVPAAARVATLAFGMGLVWVSRLLARRRRRAWQLAVAAVIAIAVGHLAKGLDFEEAGAAVLLLAALFRFRRRFDVPGDRRGLRPFAATLALFLAILGWTLYLGTRSGVLPDRLEDLLAAASILLGFRALYLWLRPLSHRVLQPVDERLAAVRIIETHGRDSLSFFALRHDKSYLFSPSRRAFLAYRVVGGAALVSGDPIGDESELDDLIVEFRRLAKAKGWRTAILGAGEERLAAYRRLGLRAIKLGDEAVLRPGSFSLEGRPIRKVRQSVTRLRKAGFRVRIVAAESAVPRLRADLDAVTRGWLGNQPERGFTMAMDDLYVPGTLVAVAEGPDGRVGGFLHLVPSPASQSYSLSTMRRRPEAPNGLTEFLVAETLAWAKEHGVAEISLNFCVFRDLLLRPHARRVMLTLDRFFQIERLHSFSRKFFPEWRPRYVCVERLSDVPAVGLAYLRVESLLVPPGPWAARSRPEHMQHW